MKSMNPPRYYQLIGSFKSHLTLPEECVDQAQR